MKKAKLLKLVSLFVLVAGLVLVVWQLFLQPYDQETIISKWKKNGKVPGNLVITYPRTGTLFPPEIASPTFLWKDNERKVEKWLVTINIKGKDEQLVCEFTEQQQWKPDSVQWANIKRFSLDKEAQVTVLGLKRSEILSGSSIVIRTCRDSVGASIFYRDVPLPFEFANKNMNKIRWRLGSIATDKPSRVMLENLPVCGNCHSFTPEGRTLAMDVDYANDKGSYVISKIEKETVLSLDKIITWSSYRQEDEELTFGLLSQISPDGRYAVSTVKDRSVFVPKNDPHYSQLFFPIKGMLVIYDRRTKKFWSLTGANNPNYCQSNPTWSPNGEYLIFARAPVYRSAVIEKYRSFF